HNTHLRETGTEPAVRVTSFGRREFSGRKKNFQFFPDLELGEKRQIIFQNFSFVSFKNGNSRADVR
ncbi:MAG TPA: hypothetical protein O0X08_00685, partial [Methanocorpusculum sp.]|nr:hypothetical protein [Methanocorpusculum sp.]